jgi:hypothetical protein
MTGDMSAVLWVCAGFSVIAVVANYLFVHYILGEHKKLSDDHFKAYERLFDLRQEILKDISGLWTSNYNECLNTHCLDFLDRAYSIRYGELQGWCAKIPPEIAKLPTIDIKMYFTDEEVADIKKARAIYGKDSRLQYLDKRLGL